MADGNDGECAMDSFTDSTGVTEEHLGEVGRKKESCCCVPGKKEKCKFCREQQRLNSEAYRNRLKDDLTRYRHERDEERNKNASLQGQLEAYQCSFTDSLQHRSRMCPNCGSDVEPVMLASEIPFGDTFAADAKTKLSDCEKFLQGLRNRSQIRKNPRAREACTVCTDETCSACKKKAKDRENAQKSRKSRQQDFNTCQDNLQWAIEYIHQQEKQKTELSWQNAQMKQLLTRRCHNCGWQYERVLYAPYEKRSAVDPRSLDFQGPSTSGLAGGGGFEQQEYAASFPQYPTPPESTHAPSVGLQTPPMPAVGRARSYFPQYLTPSPSPRESTHAHSIGGLTPGTSASCDGMYRFSPEHPIYEPL